MDVNATEIIFVEAHSDPNNAHVKFATLNVSMKVCELIKHQKGAVWVPPMGQGTVKYRGLDLNEEVDVEVDFQ